MEELASTDQYTRTFSSFEWVTYQVRTRLSLFSGSVRDNHPCTHLGSILGLGSTQSLCVLLINNFIGPYTLAPVSVERVQSVSTSFLQGILSILRSNAIKVNYSSELRVDHDIVRYVIRRKGEKAHNGLSILYEKDDFSRLELP